MSLKLKKYIFSFLLHGIRHTLQGGDLKMILMIKTVKPILKIYLALFALLSCLVHTAQFQVFILCHLGHELKTFPSNVKLRSRSAVQRGFKRIGIMSWLHTGVWKLHDYLSAEQFRPHILKLKIEFSISQSWSWGCCTLQVLHDDYFQQHTWLKMISKSFIFTRDWCLKTLYSLLSAVVHTRIKFCNWTKFITLICFFKNISNFISNRFQCLYGTVYLMQIWFNSLLNFKVAKWYHA